MNKLLKKTRDFFYEKLFKINDTPQKIAVGFGLGVFSGIFPGTGPLAALFLALIFRANRASALLGSILTNTWISLVMFIFSIKVASAILGLDWHKVYRDFTANLTGLNWQALFKISTLNIALPVLFGYLILSFALGIFSYIIVIITLKFIKR